MKDAPATFRPAVPLLLAAVLVLTASALCPDAGAWAFPPNPDVGVVVITAPPDTVFTGIGVASACTVKNYGPGNRTFPVNSRITGAGSTVYANSQTVYTLPSGAKAYVQFANWTTGKRAGMTYTVSDSTALSNDFYKDNDRKVKSVYAKGDIGPVEPLAPLDTVQVGAVYTPTVLVRNHLGGYTEAFRSHCVIVNDGGVTVHQSTVVDSLTPYESKIEHFGQWYVTGSGGTAYRIQVWTDLRGDFDQRNDTLVWWVVSTQDPGPPGFRDAGTTSIDQPPDSIEVGKEVVPTATIRNYGEVPISFEVMCAIGPDTSLRDVEQLLAGDSASVAFDPWKPDAPGTYTVVVWTMLLADGNATNDTLDKTVEVMGMPGVEERPGGGVGASADLLLSVDHNPARGAVTVRYALPAGKRGTLVFSDASGRVIESCVLFAHGSRQTPHVSPGVYFLRLASGTIVVNAKVVKIE